MKKIISLSFILVTTSFLSTSVQGGSDQRTTYNYELRNGHTVVYRGISTDISRRVSQHKASGKKFTSVSQVGIAKTRKGARKAESASLQRYRNNHSGNNPKYNKTDHG